MCFWLIDDKTSSTGKKDFQLRVVREVHFVMSFLNQWLKLSLLNDEEYEKMKTWLQNETYSMI